MSPFFSSKVNSKYQKWRKKTQKESNSVDSNLDALLLHRICDVMLKAIKTGRPLVHLIKSWAIVGPHLIEVSHSIFIFNEQRIINLLSFSK